MRRAERLSTLWRVRLVAGFVGFLAAIIFVVTVIVGADGPDHTMEALFTVAYLTVSFTLLIILLIEMVRCVVLAFVFIGRKTGLLNHPS